MNRIFLSLLICCLMTFKAQDAIAFQEISPPTTDSSTKISENPILDIEKKKKLERNANIGKVMLGGIIILGILLFAIVLVIGNRFKRIAREPLPEAKPGDPLWYLKDKKSADEEVNETEPDENNLPPS